MPFTLQEPASGLFWTSGIFGRVQLGTTPNVYTLEGSCIKNVETGSYVNHVADLLHEGGEGEEFVFGADGTITSQGKAVTAGTYLHIGVSSGTPWIKAAVDGVPVPRASALFEEASKKCECETCECDPCECVETEDEIEIEDAQEETPQ